MLTVKEQLLSARVNIKTATILTTREEEEDCIIHLQQGVNSVQKEDQAWLRPHVKALV